LSGGDHPDLSDVPGELRPAAAAALEAADVGEGHLSIGLVGPERIRELNRNHRGRDEATDVLSFPIDGGAAGVAGPRELGDVVICPQRTADLHEATVHGVLHLCGYDHETDEGEMLELQDEVMQALGSAPKGRGARDEGR
jgi:probable rRNA maturation factor